MRIWLVILAVGSLVLTGCEPYLSMTDQVPAQTRRAAELLPESPRYVGMIEVSTALSHVNDLSGENLADSLRQLENPYVRTFLDATGLNPETDIRAAYATLESEHAFSAVLFAKLAPSQLDRYLEEAPAGAGRATTYRNVPLYHLALGDRDETMEQAPDTLTLAFVGKETLAAGIDADRVTAMVDRHRAREESKEASGLRSNDQYMTLIKRVGRGSTAWLVGRDVVESALTDTEAAAENEAPGDSLKVNHAGLQQALAEWSDRVLGLSDVSSSFSGRASEKVDELKRRLRAQALSLTLTDATLDGQVYLTMRDNSSASSVVDVAEGAVAVMKLSSDELDDRHRDLLDEIEIERDGAIVHIQFSLERERLRKRMRRTRQAVIHPLDPSVRPAMVTTRREGSITGRPLTLQRAPRSRATDPRRTLSTGV